MYDVRPPNGEREGNAARDHVRVLQQVLLYPAGVQLYTHTEGQRGTRVIMRYYETEK